MGTIEDSIIDRDYEMFLSDDCLHDYLRAIRKNKPATKEENREMFLRYQNGDLEIKNTIIERNLLLVVSVAFKIGRNSSSDVKLDYIQNGVIGLIEAIDTFDVSLGYSFSTHADYRIQMRINRYRYNNERLIRRPEYLETIINKYRRLRADYEKNGKPLPERGEMCSLLNVTEDTLRRVEEDYKLDATSLDSPIKDDDKDSNDLSDLVGTEETGFSSLLDNIVIEEMLKTFKMILSSYEYYVFYYRIISSKQKTLADLGDYFGISREAIRLTEERLLEKIKKMFDDDHTLKRKFIDEIKRNYPFKKIKTIPCPMENYTMFFFLRDRFREKDQIILKEILISKLEFDSKRVAKEIDETYEYVENKKAELELLIEEASHSIHYFLFHSTIIKEYKNKIYRLDLESDLSDYSDIKRIISDYWSERNIDEVLSMYPHYHQDCPIDLLKKFFGIAEKKQVHFSKEVLERTVNYSMYGFAESDFDFNTLYPFFLENQSKFTDAQKRYLNMFIFKKEKIDQDLLFNYFSRRDSIINKLIMLYYKIQDYKKDNFSREKYLSIRDKCIKQIDKRGVLLLDLYYGINGQNMTIKAMSEYLYEDALETEKDFRRSKAAAIGIYLGTTQYSYEMDRDTYIGILKDEDFNLKSPHYDIACMFFIDGKSYETIAKEYQTSPKLTQRRVSELIKYACSVMDYYRFGITSTQRKYPTELLQEVLNSSKFDLETKELLSLYIENRSAVTTSKILNKDLEYVRSTIKRLNYLANKATIERVDITLEDITKAVMEHEATNVLTERERIILSLVYGIKNKYNPTGKRRYSIDIAEMLQIKHNIGSVIRIAKEHVAAHKIGLLKTAIDFIDRNELEDILQDQRLPLSEEDKTIIINAYGLYDSKYYSISDIAEKYGIKEPIARKRLYKGIITIKKYLNDEIKGKTIYEIDIEPYLKYFILEDREILMSLYRDNITQLELEEKYGLSTHQFNTLIQKIRMHLHDLRSGEVSGIDFDYFWSKALDDDVPFYGNKELAVEICFLYYEKRIPQSDIVKYHHPELSDTTVGELIRTFTAAMIKHQHGSRKINIFSADEVADYYNKHQEEMVPSTLKIYKRYFEKVKRSGAFTRTHANKTITYDLIKERYPDYFKLENADSNQVKTILGKCGHTLPRNTINVLASIFGVTHQNLLTDDEWEIIINFLGPLQLSNEQEKGKNNDNDSHLKKDIIRILY